MLKRRFPIFPANERYVTKTNLGRRRLTDNMFYNAIEEFYMFSRNYESDAGKTLRIVVESSEHAPEDMGTTRLVLSNLSCSSMGVRIAWNASQYLFRTALNQKVSYSNGPKFDGRRANVLFCFSEDFCLQKLVAKDKT